MEAVNRKPNECGSDFLHFFDLEKAILKTLLSESRLRILELKDGYLLDYEKKRYQALKLALHASDDNALLSTLDIDEYGTLDINKVYTPLKKEFKFTFKKKKKVETHRESEGGERSC